MTGKYTSKELIKKMYVTPGVFQKQIFKILFSILKIKLVLYTDFFKYSSYQINENKNGYRNKKKEKTLKVSQKTIVNVT